MPKPFNQITIVGTGTLGVQIALLAANAKYRVNVFDQQAGAFDEMIQKLQIDLKAKQVAPFIAYDQWEEFRRQIQQFVGLDVIYDIEMVYYRNSKDPKDHPPEALKQKVESGELGVKTGRGFYSYPEPGYLQDDFLNAGE